MKTININERLNNLSKKFMHGDPYGDMDIDKKVICKNGLGKYYYVMREYGTHIITEKAFKENDTSNYDTKMFNSVINNDKNYRFYIINVTDINDTNITGTMEKVKSFI